MGHPQWEQPRQATGLWTTLRTWGRLLAPAALAAVPAVGLAATAPLPALIAAGVGVTLSTLGVVRLRRDPWRGFVPRRKERFTRGLAELPDPRLGTALGLDGLEIENVLRGRMGKPTAAGGRLNDWLAFQARDPIGGRTTYVVIGLPGAGDRVTLRYQGTTTTRVGLHRTPLLLLGDLKGYAILRDGDGAMPYEDLYRLSDGVKGVLADHTAAAWGVREGWLFAELKPDFAQLRSALTRTVDWLRRLRATYPRELLRPLPEASAGWDLLPYGRPIN